MVKTDAGVNTGITIQAPSFIHSVGLGKIIEFLQAKDSSQQWRQHP